LFVCTWICMQKISIYIHIYIHKYVKYVYDHTQVWNTGLMNTPGDVYVYLYVYICMYMSKYIIRYQYTSHVYICTYIYININIFKKNTGLMNNPGDVYIRFSVYMFFCT
jgi:hypothetical protein